MVYRCAKSKQSRLIHTARLVNDGKPIWVVDQVKAAVADCLVETGKKPVK